MEIVHESRDKMLSNVAMAVVDMQISIHLRVGTTVQYQTTYDWIPYRLKAHTVIAFSSLLITCSSASQFKFKYDRNSIHKFVPTAWKSKIWPRT